jgi:hypothetical protein
VSEGVVIGWHGHCHSSGYFAFARSQYNDDGAEVQTEMESPMIYGVKHMVSSTSSLQCTLILYRWSA